MFQLTRTIHVMALGLWFGTVIFFSFVVAFTLFTTFEHTGANVKERPAWFPLPPAVVEKPPSEDVLKQLGKEQGTRAAGFAIAPMFDWYFLIQSICGAAALVTGLSWARINSKVPVIHKIRTAVLLVAVASVALGWSLEQTVNAKGKVRNETSDVILTHSPPSDEELKAAETARGEFVIYHLLSVAVNLLTVLTVTGSMALAAFLPEKELLASRG